MQSGNLMWPEPTTKQQHGGKRRGTSESSGRKEGRAVTEPTLRRALPVPPLGTEVTAEDDEDLCEAICWRGGGGRHGFFLAKNIMRRENRQTDREQIQPLRLLPQHSPSYIDRQG